MITTPALPEWCWKSYLGHGLLDAGGVWICVNPAICNILQRPAGEFIGRRLAEILAEPSLGFFQKAWEDVLTGVSPSRCMDLEFPAPDGRRLFTDVFLTKFDEVPGAMMLQILNITRHKETEIELAQAKETQERNEASLRMILDNLPIPVTTSRTNGDGDMTLINKEFTRLLGYSVEDAPTISRLVELNFPDPEVQRAGMAWWRDLIDRSKNDPTPAREVPFLVRARDGSSRDFLANATVVGDTLILASHDITERKRAEAQLLESRQNLERILENIPVPVHVVDPRGGVSDSVFVIQNRKSVEVFGYTLEEASTPREWMRKVFPDEAYRKGVVDWWREAIERSSKSGGVIDNAEFRLRAKDGTVRDVIYKATLVGGLLVIAMRDVTEQKQSAAALEAAYRTEYLLRSEAEAAVKMKARFLASMSHEIRTPISALVNISQSMLHESEKYTLPAEFLEHLETVRAGGQYLNLILTNLLDFSATESGHAPVRASLFYLRDWVDDIGAILGPIARARSVELVWNLPEDENERFTTDTVRLSQILLNLAHNAVKFSVKPGARVWISVSLAGEGMLRLCVADEGPGIPEERIEGLFREFGQSSADTPAIDRGVGLGLAVVRQNTLLLGGKISTRPVSPSGICFEIELPVMKTA